jgi:extradiol dioxygenase
MIGFQRLPVRAADRFQEGCVNDIVELGYITVGVADLPAFRDFATNVVGCQVGEESEQELLLRNDWCAYRLRVIKDERDDMLALGWCLPNELALQQFEDRLKSHGLLPTRGSADECAARRVRGFIALDDPDGNRLEFFAGLRLVPGDHFRSPLPIAGFVTGAEGMGHVGVWTDDLERAVLFYRNVLGLRVTDRADSPRLRAAFLRCNHRQHTLALVQKPGPGVISKALHHIEFEMLEMDDVGRAYDIAEERDIVMITLGKHPAEQALSFYMYTPAGFGFELSWGGIKIRDDTPETWHDEKSFWGHRFLGKH